jgi:DNA-binding transcriptional MerR regulator
VVMQDAEGADLRLMPIGVFSRISGLSHRALRLYAERGLLRPAYVDADTGYRYYDVHSIRAAEMIRLLRALGVSLNEMQHLIDAAAGDSLAETVELQRRRLTAELARLRAAFRLLGRVEGLNTMFRQAPSVEIVTIPSESCLRWFGAMRRGDFHDSYIALSDGLTARADQLGLQVAGREVVVLDDPPRKGLSGGGETVLNYELLLPVGEPPRGKRRPDGLPPEVVTLTGGRFARSAFNGPYYDGYRFAYARQLEWLADSGRALRDHLRMRFAKDERDTEETTEYVTELIWPVTEVGARAETRQRVDLSHRWLEP